MPISSTTTNVEQARKDTVSPTKGRDFIKLTYIIDTKTNKPVGMAPVVITFPS